MFRYTGIVVGLIVGGFGLPALAASVTSENPVATVEPVAGQVSLSRGDGFKGIKGPTNAQVGDQVMVSTRSRAKIVYLEGCVIDVNPGAVVGVAPSCKVAMAKPMMAGLELPRWSRLKDFRGGQQQSGPQWLWVSLASASVKMMRSITIT